MNTNLNKPERADVRECLICRDPVRAVVLTCTTDVADSSSQLSVACASPQSVETRGLSQHVEDSTSHADLTCTPPIDEQDDARREAQEDRPLSGSCLSDEERSAERASSPKGCVSVAATC